MKNDPKRATGRTTGLMLQALGKAVENPGTEVEFIDHHHHQNHAQIQMCKIRIQSIANKLKLDVSVDLRLKENLVDYGLYVKSNWVSPYAQRTPAEEEWKELYGEYPQLHLLTEYERFSYFKKGFEAAQK